MDAREISAFLGWLSVASPDDSAVVASLFKVLDRQAPKQTWLSTYALDVILGALSSYPDSSDVLAGLHRYNPPSLRGSSVPVADSVKSLIINFSFPRWNVAINKEQESRQRSREIGLGQLNTKQSALQEIVQLNPLFQVQCK